MAESLSSEDFAPLLRAGRIDPNKLLDDYSTSRLARNKLAQSDAQMEVNRLMQGAINPTTGEADQNAYRRAVAGSRMAGPAASEAVTTSQAQQGESQKQSREGAQFAAKRAFAFNSMPDAQLTGAAVLEGLKADVAAGSMPQSAYDAVAKSLQPGDDASKVRPLLNRVLAASLSGPESIQFYLGTPDTQDTGQSKQPGVRTGVGAGQGTPGAFQPAGKPIEVFPPRSQLMERTTTGLNADGSVRTGPIANVTPPHLAGPGGAPAPSPLGTGRIPDALRNPANKPADGAPAPAPAATAYPSGPPSSGEVTTTQGPAAQAAQSATGSKSAAGFDDIIEQGVKAQGQAAVFANMLIESRQFTTGVGAEKIKNFRNFMDRFGNTIGVSFGIDQDKLKSAESFDKLAAQIQDAQGAGSDARLSVIGKANPNADLSPGGVDLILRQLQGNADYIQARSKLAAAHPDKSDRAGFESKVASTLDPRTFQYDRMSVEQKKQYFNSMSRPEQEAFVKAHDRAAALNGR